jgi:protein-disulfide isomerase/uncharacterized membrane protein
MGKQGDAMRTWALGIVLAAAFVGAILAAMSTAQHLRIQREGLEQQSFCAISETINCDIVNASSYSEFLGIPVAWWGICYYVVLGGMALSAMRSRKDRRGTVALAWLISAAGIAYSAFLAYIASVVLGVLCIECLGMYVANIVLFLCLFAALRVRVRDLFSFLLDYANAVFGRPSNLGFSPRFWHNALPAAAVFVVGWGAMLAISSQGLAGGNRISLDEKLGAFALQPHVKIDVQQAWPVWGNPEAPIAIVEFSDFQCPVCRVAAFSIRPYLQEFRDRVRYSFVNYPLDSACNDAVPGPIHPVACYAAKAGICAQKQGDFWSFHDDLFRNQQKLSSETILALAQKRGWDRDAFAACIDDPSTATRLKEDLAVGKGMALVGTPMIFVNGRKAPYWQDPKFLQAAVRGEIRKAKKGRNS